MKSIFLALLMTIMSTLNVALYAEIVPFNATYTLSKFDITLAIVEVKLTQIDDHFVYEKKTRPKGLLKLIAKKDSAYEKSIFRIKNTSIQSVEYLSEIKRKGNLKREHYIFQADGNIDVEHKNQQSQLKADTGTLDRASMEIALMMQASEKQDVGYRVIDKGQIKYYSFTYLGERSIRNRLGQYDCQNYKVTRSSGKRSTSLCLAESVDFLPVFLEHDEKGTVIQMKLIKLELNP